MRVPRIRQRFGLRIALVLLVGQLVLLAGQPGFAAAQSPTTPQINWQTLARQVSMSLHRLGMSMGVPAHVRAAYVPGLTHEYLQVFQNRLVRGATPQQADVTASQYIYGRVGQLMVSGQPQRRRSLSERGMLFSTRDWIR